MRRIKILLLCLTLVSFSSAQLEYLSPRIRATAQNFESAGINWRNYLHTNMSGAMFLNIKDPSADLPNLLVYADYDQITWVYSPDMMSVMLRKVKLNGSLRIPGLAGITQDGRGNFWVTDSSKGRILLFKWNRTDWGLDLVKEFTGFNCPTAIAYTEGSLTGSALVLLEPRAQALKLLNPTTGALIREHRRLGYYLASDIATAWNPYFVGDTTLISDPNKIYLAESGNIYEVSPLTMDLTKTLYAMNPEDTNWIFPKDIVVTANGALLVRDRHDLWIAMFDPDGNMLWTSKQGNIAFQHPSHPAIYRQYAIVSENLTTPGTAWELFGVKGFYAESPKVSDLELDHSTLIPGDSLTGSFETNGRMKVRLEFTNALRSFPWKDTLILTAGAHYFSYPSLPPVNGTWTLRATALGTNVGTADSASFTVQVAEQMQPLRDTLINGVRIPAFLIYKTELTGDADFAIDGYSPVRGKIPAYYFGRTEVMILLNNMNRISGIPYQYNMGCMVYSKSGECKNSSLVVSQTQQGYRLPSMREWMRAYGNRPISWNTAAWFKTNSTDTSHQVGTKAANSNGLADMAGNMPELVEERFSGFPAFSLLHYDADLSTNVSYPFLMLRKDPSWGLWRMGGGYVSDSSSLTGNSAWHVPSETHALSVAKPWVDNGGYLGLRPVFSGSLAADPGIVVNSTQATWTTGDSLRFSLTLRDSARVFVRLVSPLGHVMEIPNFQDLMISEAGVVSEPKHWSVVPAGMSTFATGPLPHCVGTWKIQAAIASSRPVWYSSSFVVVKQANQAVQVGSLWADRNVVTQADFQSVMGYNPSYYQGNDWGDVWDRPADRVSFFQAVLYCNLRSWVDNLQQAYQVRCTEINSRAECVTGSVTVDSSSTGYRLPTEAEWVALNGAGASGYFWPTTADPAQYAWYGQPTSVPTQRVGQKKANSNGLFDMAGNVYVWVWAGDSVNGILKGGGKWSSLQFLSASYQKKEAKAAVGIYGLRLVRSATAELATRELQVLGGYGGGRYRPGDSVYVSMQENQPNPLAYWTGEVSLLPNIHQSSARICMPDHDVKLEVVYPVAVKTYTVAIVNGSGSGEFSAGETVCAHATISTGWAFDKWQEAIPGIFTNTPDPCFTMPAQNVQLTAQFISAAVATQYELVVVAGKGSGRFAAGTRAAIEAVADSGVFVQWTTADPADSKFIENPSLPITTILVQKNLQVVAVFKASDVNKKWALTVTRGTPSGLYSPGEEITVTPDPAPRDSVFSGWVGVLGISDNPIEDGKLAYGSHIIFGSFDMWILAKYHSISDSTNDHANPITAPEPFGFEALSQWTGSGVTPVLGTNASAGDACLCAKVGAFSNMRSQVIAATALGVIGDSLALDVRIGKNPPNPWWLGTVEVVISSKASAYSVSLGTKTLTGMPVEEWRTLIFALPNELRDLLGNDVRDLVVTLVLNGGGSDLCMDNMRFTGAVKQNAIKDWTSQCTGHGCTSADPIDLGGVNSPVSVAGIGMRWFRVAPSFIGWTPAALHFQITQTDGNELTGVWMLGSTTTPIAGWSAEQTLTYTGPSSVLFQIENYGARTYRINWWGRQ